MRWRFGLFELDEAAGELRRAGEPVPIQPKPLALLRLLLRERDRVVPFDELRKALWPDEVVSPASLNRAVTHARRAIGDTGRGVLIRSLPRRGYRFAGEVTAVDAPAADARSTPASDTASSRAARIDPAPRARGFVGRREPLARLDAARAAVLRGETRIALLSGPAGIGKSRLAEVVEDAAARDGLFTVTGRARDGEGFPAFWLWIQILRGLVEEPAFREEIAKRAIAGELALLIPLLRAFAPEAARDLPSDEAAGADLSDAQHRFLFFEAVRRALRDCARARPLVLVFEDLQWADSGSLRLLEHVAVELSGAPLLALLTLRDEPRERGHRVDRSVALLRQQPHCDSIALGGLSRGEVAELLRAAASGPVAVDLVSELYARTEGVPLFVGEAIRWLDARGELARPDRLPRFRVPLPARAVDWIRRAADGVGPPCARLLGAASVMGREFQLRAATAVAGLSGEESLDLADEAIRAGILEEQGEGAASYRFTHALFQEAIYDALPSGERARLHRAVAHRLQRQHGGALEPVLSEIAFHLNRAIAVVDAEHAFDLALRAARQAERLFAWEQAAMHYEQAVAALEHLEVVDPAVRVETLLALGEAQSRSGNRDRRRAAFEAAVGIARVLDDARAFARAAIGLCDVSEWSADPHEHAEDVLREALARTEPTDAVARARLTARLAYLAVRDRPRAEPLAREAVALARRSDDAVALQETLYILLYVTAGPDDLDERARLVGELRTAAERCTNRDAAVIALLDVACDGVMEGRLEKARRHRAAAAEIGGPHPSPSMVWHMRVWDAGLALLEGRFAEAEQGAHDALLLGRRLRHPFARACFSGQLCVLDRERGRDAAIVERLDGGLGSAIGATHWSWAVLGRAKLASGDESGAREILDRLAAPGFDAIVRGIRWNASLAEIALLAAELRADAHAKPLLALLGTARAQHGSIPIPIAYCGPFTRCVAALQAVLGFADDALALYGEALDAARALGARPTVARIQLETARLLARAGRSAQARAAVAESVALAQEMGMARLAEEARAAEDRM